MVRKYCEVCSRDLGDVHGNVRFCDPCSEKRRLNKQRGYQKTYRDKQNKGTLVPANATAAVKTGLDLINEAEIEEIIEAIWSKLVKTTIRPLFLQLDNELKKLRIRVNHIAGSQTPEWWTAALSLANILTETFSEHPPHMIRQALQKNLCISKRLAIDVMKRAQASRQYRQAELENF